MPTVKLPINTKAYKNVDDISNSITSDELINGYIDESGSSIKFPGVEEFCDLGTGINTGVDGIFWWSNINKFIAVSNGRVFRIDDKYGNFTEITGTKLNLKTPVSFTNNQTTLVMANGGKMHYTDGTNNTAEITDTGAPTTVSHVTFLDSYIIANQVGTNKIWFSEVGDAIDWDVLNFLSANAAPDILMAIISNYEELVGIGTQSTQSFYNDGVTPIVKLDGTFIERGMSAKYTLVKANNTLFWLDNDKRFIQLSDRTPTILSTPFDKFIDSFENIEDATAFNVTVAGKHFYIINFKEQNITLAYDYFLDAWFRLAEWDNSTSTFNRWIGNCYAKSVPWNLNLIGSRKDGKIYKLTNESNTSADNPIRFVRTTGHISHGTDKWKISSRLRLRIKRGYGTGSTQPVVQIRYKDDGELNFSDYIDGQLGLLGDKEFFIDFEPLGTYRTRQYEIVITDNVPFVLVSAEEDVQVES